MLLLIQSLTLLGLAWVAAQAAELWRQWRLLKRVRALFASAPLHDASPWDISERWAAGGSKLPEGWVTARLRDLTQVKAAGHAGAAALRGLARQHVERMDSGLRLMGVALVLFGIAGTVSGLVTPATGVAALLQLARGCSVLDPLSLPVASARAAFACSAVGLLGAAVLWLLGLLLSQLRQSLLQQVELFSITALEPRILIADENETAERFARVLDESSRRFEAAVQPFAAGLDQFSQRLRASVDDFANRLDNASHNVLHSVEDMREAAAKLGRGTAGLDDYHARIEATYQRIEAVASQVAGSQAGQQEELGEMARGLEGIVQSLVTVVASANETQLAMARVADDVAGTAAAVQEAARTDREEPRSAASGTDGVTLRRIAEQQQQFINVLDHRLTRLGRK